MTREIVVGAAQLGPIEKEHSRREVVDRMLALLDRAHRMGCDLVVYPELALTTFFPRWYMEDQAAIDAYFEPAMPGNETQPLFDQAKRLGLGFSFGYAELAEADSETHRFNTSILVDKAGAIVGKYRKIHLPGHAENEPYRDFQHLEKRYFEVGDLGFGVWPALGGNIGMCICNDRRWPETYRVMGLQDVEMVLCGYNTPVHNPPAPEMDNLSNFHNHLVMQSGAYQNGTWVVGVAKCGAEAGVPMIGQSAIIAPSGEIVAQATSLDDELIVAACDLDRCAPYKSTVFNFAAHRRPEHYGLIVERTGAEPPGSGG